MDVGRFDICVKMRVGGENQGGFFEFLGTILVFELKTGILGGAIGHLVK